MFVLVDSLYGILDVEARVIFQTEERRTERTEIAALRFIVFLSYPLHGTNCSRHKNTYIILRYRDSWPVKFAGHIISHSYFPLLDSR